MIQHPAFLVDPWMLREVELDHPVADYDQYVERRPRYEGVRSFRPSRAIVRSQRSSSDPPQAEAIDGLDNRQNELVLELIREHGVQPYEGSVLYLPAALGAGRGAASSPPAPTPVTS